MSEPNPWPAEHLSVRLNGQPCGALWQEKGRMRFAYREDWLVRSKPLLISQSLPLQADVYDGPEVEAFFGNLLPEGDVRTSVSRALQISARNDYALLNAIGGDCAGALSLESADATVVQQTEAIGSFLDTAALTQLAQDLPLRPLLVGESGIRLSLAGAQIKLALCNAGGMWVKPAPGGVTTHILKPPIRDIEGSVENEAFCMMLAKQCALGVPDCWIHPQPLLYVVVRYDRQHNPLNGRVERLHQEDFCQALGVAAKNKYQNEGGPGLKECFDLVRRVCTDPVGDRLRLLHWVIFNFLIGNHDAHAKNISLLYADGKVQLAPFYDLLSTVVYQGLDDKFAMKIGGAKSLRYMTMRNWDLFAEECGLNPRFVRQQMALVEDKILKGTKSVMESITRHHFFTIKNVDVILDRLKKTAAMFDAEKPQTELPLDLSGLLGTAKPPSKG